MTPNLTQPSTTSVLSLQDLLQELELEKNRRLSENRIKAYVPYPKQALFHALGATKRERLLRAGSQQGKTLAGAAEMAMHLTGLYPEWWEGRRWDLPIRAWAGGKDGTSVRDSICLLLLGPPDKRGTGMIPKAMIDDIRTSRGLADGVDTVIVRHSNSKSDRSYLNFKSYDQGRERWQAATLDLVWLDEEPKADIYSEALSRTNGTGGCLYMTFTPLLGMSEVVRRFLMEDSPDRSDTNLTIDDALHIPEAERARIIASYQPHEREARTLGTPALGSGRIFPVAEAQISVEAFSIPAHWVQIGALDFGWDHPTAAVKLAWDRDADVVYVTHSYRRAEAIPSLHISALRPWGAWLPWAWPSDGFQHSKDSGEPLAAQYRDGGLRMLPEHAQYEGDRGVGVEAGLMDMLERMESARLYVFSHLTEWFEEFRLYHRQDGKVIKIQDDLMAATRYGIMSLRFAKTAEKKVGMKPYMAPALSPVQHGGSWLGR